MTAATLTVSSFPSGAQVTIDGVNAGKVTPMNIALREGDHVVTVMIPNSGWNPDTPSSTTCFVFHETGLGGGSMSTYASVAVLDVATIDAPSLISVKCIKSDSGDALVQAAMVTAIRVQNLHVTLFR